MSASSIQRDRVLARTQRLALSLFRVPSAAVLAYLGILALAAAAGYLRIFAQFSNYDDEGYILVSLREFLRGGSLYGHVYTQYGPFPYELWGAVYRILGQQVTPDNARFLVIAVWLGIALLIGVIVRRMAGSVVLGLTAMALGFAAATSITNETMHPGGLAALTVVATMAAATLMAKRPRLRFAVIGFLISALVLTKINIGGAAVLAMCLAVATATPSLARRRWLFVVVSAVCIATPFIVMNRDLGQAWAENLAVIIALGVCSLVVTLARHRAQLPVARGPERTVTLIVAFLAGLAGMSLVIILLGTHPSDLFHGVVIGPLGQRSAFSIPANIPTVAVDLGVFGLIGAFAANFLGFGEERPLFAGALRIAIGACIAAWASGTAPISLTPDPTVLGVVLAFTWLAACPPRGALAPGDDRLFVRAVLAAMPILGVLVVYPVAGSQVGFAALAFVPAAGVIAADGIEQLRSWSTSHPHRDPRRFSRGVQLATGAVLAATIYQLLIQPVVTSVRTFRSLQPLPFPGARLVRQPASVTSGYADLVRVIHQRCDTFVTLPGMNSFYVWADANPPTGFNTTGWMYLLSSAQQSQVVGAILPVRRLCLIRSYPILADWTNGRQPPPPRPLWLFLNSPQFRQIYSINGYDILLRTS